MLANPSASTSKKATNLSLNSELLQQARALNINLSATLEAALVEAVRQKQAEQWQAANAQAIADYNRQIEQNGLFGDDVRGF